MTLLHIGSSAAPNLAATSEPVRARVIIPAFKANRTIRQCVTAILNSRVNGELEIVVVDDGGHMDLAERWPGCRLCLLLRAAQAALLSPAIAAQKGSPADI
jgi:hypothetical protein